MRVFKHGCHVTLSVFPRHNLVVYHLRKKSANFGWNVNGKMNFVSPNGHFLGITGFLER